MIKNLRFVLLSMLMMLAGTVMAEKQVTIDFNNNYATLFPTLPGTSSSDSHDGDFTEATTSAAVDGVTVTVSPAAEGVNNANRIWSGNPRLRMYSGTLTISSSAEKITKMEITRSTNAGKVANQNTVDTGTMTTSDQQSNGVVEWAGEAQSITISIAGNTQFSQIVVTLGGDPGTVVPEKKMVRVYKKATSVETGMTYIMVANNEGALKMATNVTGNYGYLQVEGVTEVNGEVSYANNSGEFTFTNTDNGYTIKQADSRYLYQTGTYNSFNVTAEPTEGELWTVEPQGDGTFKITNINVQKFIQFDPQYTSYGSYSDQRGILPSLYVFDREEESGDTPVEYTIVSSIKEFASVATGEVVALTLNNAQVVYVNEYSNNKELFVRDATGAVDLSNLDINAELGQVLSGTIIGKRGARSGFTVAMLPVEDTNANTVTVGAAQTVAPVELAIDEASTAFVCDLIKIDDVVIENGKACADGVQLALFDRFNLGIISQLKADGSHYNLTGLMYDGGTQYGPELVVTAATYADGSPLVEEGPTAVAGIEALLALESPSTNLELTLTNAQVLFNDNNYIYVRENGKALCFYQMPDAIKTLFATNAVINGKINVDYEVYKLLPEVKKNAKTTADGLNAAEGEDAVPTETTLADVAEGKNVCDLVKVTANLIREVTYKEDGETVSSTNYYLMDGDTKLIVVNNGKNLKTLADEGVETVTVTGIVNTNNNAYQIKLVKNAADTAGINTVTTDAQQTAVYNLNGQRVEKTAKGLYIQNGRKFIVK